MRLSFLVTVDVEPESTVCAISPDKANTGRQLNRCIRRIKEGGMRKAKLSLDELQVDSFSTAVGEGPSRGTVHGHYDGIYDTGCSGCGGDGSQSAYNCADTCGPTYCRYQNTCMATCNGNATCRAECDQNYTASPCSHYCASYDGEYSCYCELTVF